MANCANQGLPIQRRLMVDPEAYKLLEGCVSAAMPPPITEAPSETKRERRLVHLAAACATCGSNTEGHWNWCPRLLADEQLYDECERRGMAKCATINGLSFAADDELRAECERRWKLRHLAEFIEYDGDVMMAAVAMGAAPPQSPEAAAFRARMDDPVPRSKYAVHRELETAHAHLVFDIEKAKTERDEWKRRSEAAEAKLAPEPRQAWPQPKIGDLVAAIVERVAADDDEGACDVVDSGLFQERLVDLNAIRGGKKLAADIRGVIVAACREAQLRTGDIPTRELRKELRAREHALTMGGSVALDSAKPTPAGRVWAAEQALKECRIDTPEQFMRVLETGRDDECGPGIAAMPRAADEHYVDPLDLLAEDA